MFPINNSSHMEVFKVYKLAYETLRNAAQMHTLDFLAGDCPLHDIEKHIELEDLNTMSHYFKCNKCRKIYLSGFVAGECLLVKFLINYPLIYSKSVMVITDHIIQNKLKILFIFLSKSYFQEDNL